MEHCLYSASAVIFVSNLNLINKCILLRAAVKRHLLRAYTFTYIRVPEIIKIGFCTTAG